MARIGYAKDFDMFALFMASTANAQSIYDKCIAAIEAQDTSKLEEIATTVKRLRYPGINAKKADSA